jgi:hypothetical protein
VSRPTAELSLEPVEHREPQLVAQYRVPDNVGDVGVTTRVVVLVGVVDHAVPVLETRRHAGEIVVLHDPERDQCGTPGRHQSGVARPDRSGAGGETVVVVVGSITEVGPPRAAHREPGTFKLAAGSLEHDDAIARDPGGGKQIDQGLDELDPG